MGRKFKGIYWLGIFIALALIGADIYFFYKTRWFLPILIVSFSLGWLQFWIDFFREVNRQKDIELKFIDFMRSLVESIKSGVSIPRSIRNVSQKDFGALNPFLKKLANQIEWGIPTRRALTTFSLDTNNRIIKRSVSIIVEAEQSGGDITDILSSVVSSVLNIKKMKEEAGKIVKEEKPTRQDAPAKPAAVRTSLKAESTKMPEKEVQKQKEETTVSSDEIEATSSDSDFDLDFDDDDVVSLDDL